MNTYPTCIVCDGAGCEFCPGTALALALAACLAGFPARPIEMVPGTWVRAEVVARSIAPDALANIEARRLEVVA
jgi:hypothetical protein